MLYTTVNERLTPEARSLLIWMVDSHNRATGDRLFMFIGTLGGSSLEFLSSQSQSFPDVDEGALGDLAQYGLIRRDSSGRDPCYRITGESLAFYNWMMQREGSSVEQVEAESVRLTEGIEFARRHPGASRHLGNALELLRTGD